MAEHPLGGRLVRDEVTQASRVEGGQGDGALPGSGCHTDREGLGGEIADGQAHGPPVQGWQGDPPSSLRKRPSTSPMHRPMKVCQVAAIEIA
jgi:hypothetical protein